MKRIVLIIGLILLTFSVNGQSWLKSNSIFSTNMVIPLHNVFDSQGNVIVSGIFTGSIIPNGGDTIVGYGGRDIFLAKYDEDFNLLWIKIFGSSDDDDQFQGLSLDSEDNIYLSSAFWGTFYYNETDFFTAGGFDIFIAKFTSEGNEVWVNQTGTGLRLQRAISTEITSSNELLLSGLYLDSITINNDTTLYTDHANVMNSFYSKFSITDGSLIWAKNVLTISEAAFSYGSQIFDITVGSDFYVLSGIFKDSVGFENDTLVSLVPGEYDSFIIKTDFDGNIQWVRKIQSPSYAFLYKSIPDNDNNIYSSGYYDGTPLTIQTNSTESIDININEGEGDLFFTKYDPLGNLLWSNRAGGIANELTSSASLSNIGLSTTGWFEDTLSWGGIDIYSNGAIDRNMFLVTLDFDGNFRGANYWGGVDNSDERTRSLAFENGKFLSSLQSNSTSITIGDSVYLNPSGNDLMIIGTLGCSETQSSITKATGVTNYMGPNSGSIEINVEGTSGPYKYSVDNGLTYHESNIVTGLSLGTYDIVVLNNENCAEYVGEAEIIERIRVLTF